jgi:hypothetical protein
MSFYDATIKAIKSVDEGNFIPCQGFFSISKLDWQAYPGNDGYIEYSSSTIIEGYHVYRYPDGYPGGVFWFTYGDSSEESCKSIEDGMNKCQAIFELYVKTLLNPKLDMEIPVDKLRKAKY